MRAHRRRSRPRSRDQAGAERLRQPGAAAGTGARFVQGPAAPLSGTGPGSPAAAGAVPQLGRRELSVAACAGSSRGLFLAWPLPGSAV